MIGERENRAVCAFCGGRVLRGTATVPFVLDKSVIVVRDVPAFVCQECGEPFMTGRVSDAVVVLLTRLKSLGAEVSVVSYEEAEDWAPLAAH